MRIAPTLRRLRLGSDVAEEDEFLDRYFVKTSVFHDLVHDQADLILGPKGCGKSAIFKVLRDGHVDIPELLDVDILPAFNAQGSVFFQRILENDVSRVSEQILRQTWKAYVVSLIGNHIVDVYSEVVETDFLREYLERAELRASVGRPRTAWNAVVSKLLLKPKLLEGGVSLNESGMPGLTAKLEFQPDAGEEAPLREPTPVSNNKWASATFDLETILEAEIDIFKRLGRRVWVVFDRLDEAFQDSPAFEQPALRGLLRAHGDISSHGSAVRTKLFLRSDVLDRITQEKGFVNLTHLRPMEITWTEQSIQNMIVRRLLANGSFVRAFPQADLRSYGEEARKEIINLLIPTVTVSAGNYVSGLRWVLTRVTDGTGALSPRNVLTFLRAARERQLAICDVTDPTFNGALLSRRSLDEAWIDVSRKRLLDTLYAEFQSLRGYVERFEYGPNMVSQEYIGEILGSIKSAYDLDKVIRDLIYAGFLTRRGPEHYRVSELYRPALSLHATTPNEERSASWRNKTRRRSRKRSVTVEGSVILDKEGESGSAAPVQGADEQSTIEPLSSAAGAGTGGGQSRATRRSRRRRRRTRGAESPIAGASPSEPSEIRGEYPEMRARVEIMPDEEDL